MTEDRHSLCGPTPQRAEPVSPEQGASPLLEAITLQFGPAGRALAEPLSFTVQPSHCLVLLGPNGAGKTSLLRTLIGSLPPLAGQLRWQGCSMASLSAQERARQVAFAAPRTGDSQDFRVEEFVLLGRIGARGYFAQPGEEDRRQADLAIARMGLEAMRARRLGELSDGERQLAALARALAQRAQVLVLDEPAASLDPGRQAALLQLIGALVAEGQAVIMSTHDPNHALAVADEVLLWQQPGHIMWGDATTLLQADRLEDMYRAPVRWYQSAEGARVVGVGTTARRSA